MELTQVEGPKLLGKVVIKGKIKSLTGLHIGASQQALEIGGVDNPVVRDPITKMPYIPGSSLKGKMRALLEISLHKKLVEIKKGKPRIHFCNEPDCEVCRIFGRPAEMEGTSGNNFITRLSVRDTYLTKESAEELKELETGFFMTEIKWENQLDRLTSAANPRQTERVPAGAVFAFEMVYDIYDELDLEYLKYVFESIKLVEDSYIGGQGTRGYGKVKFQDVMLSIRNLKYYRGEGEELVITKGEDIKSAQGKVMNQLEKIKSFLGM